MHLLIVMPHQEPMYQAASRIRIALEASFPLDLLVHSPEALPGRYDAICFHCQQCVEKYLKARRNEAGLRIVKTHDLGMLLRMVQPLEPLWMGMDAPLKRLTA